MHSFYDNVNWVSINLCTAVTCEAPMIAGSNFAKNNISYPFRSVISVECDRCRVMVVEGVRMEEGTLMCATEGKWDKPIPTCQCEQS